MLNNTTLVGRLVRDPDLRYTPNGVAVANFTVAVNRPFKNQQGEQEADFINCVTWRKQAENLANYMNKGSMVGVAGSIQTRTYDDKDGKTVFVTEVLANQISFLESKKNNAGGGNNNNQQTNQNQQNNNQNNNQQQPQSNQQPSQDPFANNDPMGSINDDDLPF